MSRPGDCRGYHQREGPGGGGSTERWSAPTLQRARQPCDSTGLSLYGGTRPDHQLPPPEKLAVVVGQCVDRTRAVAGSLCGSHPRALPVFLLWRCHVDCARSSAAVGSADTVERVQPGNIQGINV